MTRLEIRSPEQIIRLAAAYKWLRLDGLILKNAEGQLVVAGYNL